MLNEKVSDGSQPPMTLDLSPSESAGSRSLRVTVWFTVSSFGSCELYYSATKSRKGSGEQSQVVNIHAIQLLKAFVTTMRWSSDLDQEATLGLIWKLLLYPRLKIDAQWTTMSKQTALIDEA